MFSESHIRRRRYSGTGPEWNQSTKIIKKFGGAKKLSELTGLNLSTIYRWMYAAPQGTDGLVPSSAIKMISEAAKAAGVKLTAKDWQPEKTQWTTKN